MPSAPRRLRSAFALLLALSMLPGSSAGPVTAADQSSRLVASAAVVGRDVVIDRGSRVEALDVARQPIVDPIRSAAPAAARTVVTVQPPKAKTESKSKPKTTSKSSSKSAASYHARNHVWMPALGISRSITFYACGSSRYPGNRVYRWGCGGRNNVYLFGHASSVFRPLHDAYVRHHLRKGMTLYYANASGKVAKYKVSWWRVTTPDKGDFAFASLSRPSVTLQTCLGARSQYRLIVRLTKVG
jgi:sortase (surface protein transpeptidase)